MNARVYYQDFTLNTPNYFGNDKLVIDKEKATFIDTLHYDEAIETRIEFVDKCWHDFNHIGEMTEINNAIMNCRFGIAGHTSMSIGDYIEFEDGEIYQAASVDWKIIKPKKE